MTTLYLTRKDLLKWRQDLEFDEIQLDDFMKRDADIRKSDMVIFTDKQQTKVLKDEPIQKTLIERLYERL